MPSARPSTAAAGRADEHRELGCGERVCARERERRDEDRHREADTAETADHDDAAQAHAGRQCAPAEPHGEPRRRDDAERLADDEAHRDRAHERAQRRLARSIPPSLIPAFASANSGITRKRDPRMQQTLDAHRGRCLVRAPRVHRRQQPEDHAREHGVDARVEQADPEHRARQRVGDLGSDAELAHDECERDAAPPRSRGL